MSQLIQDTPLIVAGRRFASRLLVGTGKYRDFDETAAAIEASAADVVTFAVRRTNLGQNPDEPNLLDAISPSRYTLLPNTAGCYTATEAVQLALRAHKAMAPNAFSVGWDVAFGERGIYLMEGNLISMVALHIGMRYGYMALVWPDSCLLWAALAQWTLGKPDGPRGDAAALAARLQSGRREAELLLEHATFQAEELTLQLLAAKQRDPEAQGAEVARLPHELELRQGEQFGVRRELAHLDTLAGARLS